MVQSPVLHTLLKKQLDQFGIIDPTVPPDADTWRQFLNTISATYAQTDDQDFARTLFDQSNDAVFILGLDLKLISVNQKAADMLGYAIPELLQMSLSDVVSPKETAHSQSVIQAMMDGEQIPPFERTYRHKDGSDILVEVNTELVGDADGSPRYIQGIVRDI